MKSPAAASKKRTARKPGKSKSSPGIFSKAKKVVGKVLSGAAAGAAKGAVQGAAEAGSKATGIGETSDTKATGKEKIGNQEEPIKRVGPA